MDFLRRGTDNQPQIVRSNGGGQGPAAGLSSNVDKVKRMVDSSEPKWLRVTFVVLLFSLTILTLAIAVLFYTGRVREANYVDDTKVQAVFLTNGQVYFGAIADITSQYIDLQDIYYLNSQSQATDDDKDDKKDAQPASFSLVKLGCELHGPSDQMLINREQVSFWENLKTDGKVAKAIDQWKSQNPNGQKCDDNTTTNSTQQSTTGTTNTGTSEQQ